MRQDFLGIVEKLKTDNITAVSVFDADKLKKIIPATYGKELVATYGSVENFFESLKSKGVVNILVQEYRKNGQGIKSKGEPLRFNFSQNQQSVAPVVYEPLPIQAVPMGLNGMGLGFAEIMKMNTEAELKKEYEKKNDYLTAENERLKEIIYTLKEERLESKYNADNKSQQTDLFKTILEVAPQLMGVFKQQPIQGLNAPQNSNLSEVKQQLISMIQSNVFSDGLAEVVFQVVNKINSVEGFYQNLESLLNPKPFNDGLEE